MKNKVGHTKLLERFKTGDCFWHFSIVPILAVIFLLCGCSSIQSHTVVIDRLFLCDIEKEFQEEAKSCVDRSDVYNHIWKHNFFELIYLASKGDHTAIDVGILLIGQHGYPSGLFEEFELFAVPTVESDPNYFWRAIERMDPDVQLTALWRLESLHGGFISLERVRSYIESNPAVKRRFDELQKEDKQNEQTNLSYFAALASSDCTLLSPNQVVINREFLYEIEKAFRQEKKSGKNQSEIYNKLWEQNYYELIYLVTYGDKKAIEVSISLMGQKQEPSKLFKNIKLLATPTYEGDQDYFWIALVKEPIDVQLKVIYICERYEPIDWCSQECYFNKKPELKKLYEARYGLIKTH
jgi:hypothetical protein